MIFVKVVVLFELVGLINVIIKGLFFFNLIGLFIGNILFIEERNFFFVIVFESSRFGELIFLNILLVILGFILVFRSCL